jgi:hypothetical protein
LGHGGVFYVKNSAAITLSETVATKSYYQTLHAPDKGSFMYSEAPGMVLSISGTDIECSTLGINPSILQSMWSIGNVQSSDRGGAFYIKNVAAEVQSNSNNF